MTQVFSRTAAERCYVTADHVQQTLGRSIFYSRCQSSTGVLSDGLFQSTEMTTS